MSRGKLIVVSGPSGVGKTTICKRILKKHSDIRFSVSATSRPKRRDEENGREYIFLSEREFRDWIRMGHFVEYAEVHGNLYGTPKKTLNEDLEKGFHVLLDIDVQGAKNLMKLYPDDIYFFIIPPDIIELKNRLLKRNTDKNKAIRKRLANALKELKCQSDFKYVIENRDIEETVEEILSVIKKETMS